MSSPKTSLKNDKYKKSRGGYSRLLDISCAQCGTHLCLYQKDGPGILKRMYLDRIQGTFPCVCPTCNAQLGTPMIYKPEDRSAIRLIVGSVSKKITKK